MPPHSEKAGPIEGSFDGVELSATGKKASNLCSYICEHLARS